MKPNRFLTETEIETEYESKDVIVPFSIQHNNSRYTHSICEYNGEVLTFDHFNPKVTKWDRHSELQLPKDNIFVKDDGPFSSGIRIRGERSRDVREAYTELGQHLNSLYNSPLIPYDVASSSKLAFAKRRDECDCYGNKTSSTFSVIGGPDIPVRRCKDCGTIDSIIRHNEEYGMEEFLDSDHARENLSVKKAYSHEGTTLLEVDPTSDHLTYDLVGAMLILAENEILMSIEYNINEINILFSITDGSVSGAMIWTTDEDGCPIFLQLYIRPGFRREGVGYSTAACWAHDVIDEKIIYVESPNKSSQQLINELRPNAADYGFQVVEQYRLTTKLAPMNSKLWQKASSQIPE